MLRLSEIEAILRKPLPETIERKRTRAPYERAANYVVDSAALMERLIQGDTDAQIGDALGVPDRAISNRIRRLAVETGARNRTQLAVWYATGKIKP